MIQDAVSENVRKIADVRKSLDAPVLIIQERIRLCRIRADKKKMVPIRKSLDIWTLFAQKKTAQRRLFVIHPLYPLFPDVI